ncbi:MAG TPA: MCE family protein [Kiritimatiellae bacterium]|nr:MCE family protein [Kiritimatiellia bacterium]
MRRSRLREFSMEMMVGAFTFMVLMALAFFTIIFSRENIFRPNYFVRVKFSNVMGLREGDNVYLRGVSVGRIKRLEVIEDGVLLTASLDVKPVLHTDYRAEILPSSILGGRYLNLYEGTSDAPLLPEGTVLQGSPPADLIEEATEVVNSIRQALEEGGVLDNLQETVENLREITQRVREGEGVLGVLVSDRQMGEDLRRIVADLREVSGRVKAGKGMLGHLLAEDDTLYEEISATAAALREIAQKVNAGDGTLGKLVQDKELYEEARKLLSELRAAVDDFRENTPLTTFTSIFFGAF